MSEPSLRLAEVERTFVQGGAPLPVLRGVNLELQPGECVALLGPSGAGKSTLLQIAGLLEKPDRGSVLVAGRACETLGDGERTALRRTAIGFVYQFHHLLPEFSAVENVMIPQMIAHKAKAEARRRALDLLGTLGLAARATHRPARLSGGEQQRVAIARAVANGPRVLLADEPTGNLDPATAATVFESLIQLIRSTGLSALIATHNFDLAARMDRRLALANGIVTPA